MRRKSFSLVVVSWFALVALLSSARPATADAVLQPATDALVELLNDDPKALSRTDAAKLITRLAEAGHSEAAMAIADAADGIRYELETVGRLSVMTSGDPDAAETAEVIEKFGVNARQIGVLRGQVQQLSTDGHGDLAAGIADYLKREQSERLFIVMALKRTPIELLLSLVAETDRDRNYMEFGPLLYAHTVLGNDEAVEDLLDEAKAALNGPRAPSSIAAVRDEAGNDAELLLAVFAGHLASGDFESAAEIEAQIASLTPPTDSDERRIRSFNFKLECHRLLMAELTAAAHASAGDWDQLNTVADRAFNEMGEFIGRRSAGSDQTPLAIPYIYVTAKSGDESAARQILDSARDAVKERKQPIVAGVIAAALQSAGDTERAAEVLAEAAKAVADDRKPAARLAELIGAYLDGPFAGADRPTDFTYRLDLNAQP